MKTRFAIILVPLLLLKLTLSAQVWYDEQATWYRSVSDGLTGSKSIIEIKVEKDTLFEGQQVKKLTFQTKFRQGGMGEVRAITNHPLYEYESNDSVFYWTGQQFRLVYNFNLVVGDTISYDLYPGESIPLVLDSISTQIFSNQPRRIQYFTSLSALNPNAAFCNFPNNYVIIEGIGSVLNRNPKHDFSCATDLPRVSLRCFSDSFINYNPDNLICDIIDRIVSTVEIASAVDFQIFPNPTTDWLQIKVTPTQSITVVIVYDLLGHQTAVPIHQNRLDISLLPNGVYFLKIALDGQIFTKKIIKKGR